LGAYDEGERRAVTEAAMPKVRPAAWLLLLLPLVGGCVGLPRRVESRLPPNAARGVVFVAPGAGGGQHAARVVAAEADSACLGLHVRSFDWGHGVGRGLADASDVAHARRQGQLLAAEVRRCLDGRPGVSVSLVGHSAGCAVVLAAAECLPADSLDRVVLLAPAVSPCYDLRRALLSARRGVDAYVSERDWLWLGLGTTLAGTLDGGRGPAAGRIGFYPLALSPGQEALAWRLRQHPWHPCVGWTGNHGGHAGTLEPAYVRAYLLPLLTPPRP
jgi:hypothetical protein